MLYILLKKYNYFYSCLSKIVLMPNSNTMRRIFTTILLCIFAFSSSQSQSTFLVEGINYKITSGTEPLLVEVIKKSPQYSGAIVIPSSVEFEGKSYSVASIGEMTFYDCWTITSIIIPNSVTSIGDYAFYTCTGLTSIDIPNSVTSIGNYTFLGCTGAYRIIIPNSVTSIGNFAFADCRGFYLINIPNSVTSIGDYAFANYFSTLPICKNKRFNPQFGDKH